MDRGTVTQVLADRLRKLRAERGWSAQQLADECARAGFGSLTRSTIAKIESGTRKSVTADEIAALAQVLDVTPTDLLASPARSEVMHRTIMMVDIAGFADASRGLHQVAVRRALVDTLRMASSEAGVDFADAMVESRGDGMLILLPPETPMDELAGRFPDALAAALRRYNSVHDVTEHLQLRLVLHAGEVRRDDHGVAGPAVNLAARLLDAQEAKSVLRLTPGVLALIASESFYREVVRHVSDAEPESFRRIEVSGKHMRTHAWLRLFDENRSARPQRRARGVPAVWGGVPIRNPNFTGRAELLDRLDDLLTGEGATVVLSATLHGMGGIGKSQLAIEYVYRHLDRYDVVWWVQASEPAQIRASLTDLARQLRLPAGTDASVAATLEALRLGEPYNRWLLIFDNVESAEAVQPFLPANGPGEVIVTSRSPHWAGVAQPLDVPVFSRNESIELMRRRGLEINDVAEAELLAERLGDLPLAIEQAAAWQMETGMQVDEYLRLFDEKMADILDVSAPAGYGLSVAATWDISFDNLRQRHPGAYQLLQMGAFFASGAISRTMFTGVAGISVPKELDEVLRDPLQLARAIREMNRHSLAKIDNRNGTLQVHRLVRTILRSQMSPKVREEMRHAVHLLLANFDPGSPTSPRDWPRYRELLAHVHEADAVTCEDTRVRWLVINLTRFQYACGDFKEAARLAGRAHEEWSERFGEADSGSLTAATIRGLLLYASGRFAEAANINGRTLELCRAELGEDSEGALQSELVVVLGLVSDGVFGRARELCEKIYQRATGAFGDNASVTLYVAQYLSFTHRLCGDHRRARDLDERTFQALGDVVGPDTVDTMSVWSAVAIDRRELGDYHDALRIQEQVAERIADLVGEGEADLLWPLAGLAVARRKVGDHAEALRLSGTVLASGRRRYGADHPHVPMWTVAHSLDLRYDGDLDQARELGSTAVESYRRLFGERHPYTLAAQVNLAVTLRLTGDATLARRQHEQALQGLRAALGDDHPHVIACAVDLASDLAELGEVDIALSFGLGWKERAQRVLGEDHPVTLAAVLNHAIDLSTAGRVDEGAILHADAMSRYRRVLSEDHPATQADRVRIDCDIEPPSMY